MLAGVGCKDYDDDIDKLNDRLDELTTGKIATLESQLSSLQTSVDNLKSADEALGKRIDELKSDADANAKDIEALEKAQEQLQKDIEAIEKRPFGQLCYEKLSEHDAFFVCDYQIRG